MTSIYLPTITTLFFLLIFISSVHSFYLPGVAPRDFQIVLAGHVDNSEFALATTTFEPFVLSGGKDKSIILWNINDQPVLSKYRPITKFAGNRHFIAPRCFFHGHTDTIEDIEFSPTNAQEFCSVGDDSKLMFWDTRVGGRAVIQVENAHHVDIHSVSWNIHDTNLVLTGSADNAVQMFDRRYLFSDSHDRFPVCRFQGHDSAVFCVQWCPDKSSVFGSSADDGIVNIWDHEKVEGGSVSVEPNATPDLSSAGLIFRHVGHRNKVVEFQWNSNDPWTIVSISDDCKGPGGGTLQIWRMMDIIYGGEENQEERIAELNRLRPCTVGRDPASIKNLSLNFLN